MFRRRSGLPREELGGNTGEKVNHNVSAVWVFLGRSAEHSYHH